jgi:hypothetical protein
MIKNVKIILFNLLFLINFFFTFFKAINGNHDEYKDY